MKPMRALGVAALLVSCLALDACGLMQQDAQTARPLDASGSASARQAPSDGSGERDGDETERAADSGTPAPSGTVNVSINGAELIVELADNSSARAFAELLAEGPLAVEMTDYGGFEKVGSLGTSLPANDASITAEPGDLILYQGNRITIYYGTNSWSLTRLGKIQGVGQDELKRILGEGEVTAVFRR